jgi:hypothetical protein
MVPMSDNVGKESGWPDCGIGPAAGSLTPAVVNPNAAGRIPTPSGPVNVGTHSVFSLSGPRRGVSRLLAALVVLAAVLLGAEAHAAVPMCSEDGRSIAAPPIGTAVRGLVLEASVPCAKASPLATRSLPAEPGAPVTTPAPSPLRAVPVSFIGVACAASELLALATDAPVLPLGIGRTIERPPRA